jgi:hypothetical protein
MFRVWEVEPSSKRIVEDIQAFPRVLQKIIDAQGCVVPDEFLRSGRRERRLDDKGDCTARLRGHQRKANMAARPLHPDAHEAYEFIRSGVVPAGVDGGDIAGIDLLLQAAEEAEALEYMERDEDEQEVDVEAMQEPEDAVDRIVDAIDIGSPV